MITPGRTGISPLPGNIFYSQDIDVNYQAGLVWGRIPEFRFVYHPNEQGGHRVRPGQQEQYFGGSAGGAKPLLPTIRALPRLTRTVVNGVAGLPGTQLNDGTTTVNAPALFPDMIVKVAFDPSPKFHFEFGGVERQFRVAVNIAQPPRTALCPSVHQSLTGGGGFLNLNVQLFTGFRFLTNNFWSQGGGRYIFGQAPDLIVNPDGSLSAIRAASTVTGFEYTHKNTLLYVYYGGIYIAATLEPSTGRSTATASTDRRRLHYGRPLPKPHIQEITFGFNQTLWRDAKYGALNLMGQYSYLLRNPWSVAPGHPTNAN